MNINTSSIEKYVDQISFKQELYLFFSRFEKTHTQVAWAHFQNLILSFIDDLTTPIDLVYFFQFIRKNIGWTKKNPTTEGIVLFDEIFKKIIAKKRKIFQSYTWSSKYIWSLFHNLRNFQNIPIEFFEDMTTLIEWINHWSWTHISEILRTIEPYRNTNHGRLLLYVIGDKILSMNMELQSFSVVQSLIINLEHLDVEIPDTLLNRWNHLQNEEGEKNSTPTQYEDGIFNTILKDTDTFDGFSLERNIFICGYEVDIVVYDTQGDIFAIIESDWTAHQKASKTRNKDKKRDALFFRRGITDTIIRCTNQ